MLPGERDVAGLRCTQVLAALSDYMDGTLPEDLTRRVAAHVAACDWCEGFGGRFTHTVTALRMSLRESDPVPVDVEARLRARLKSAI